MADLSLRYLLYGEDKTASKSIKGVGAQASSTASLVSGGLSKMGNMLGGEVGDMLNRVSMGFDQIGEKSKGMGAKMVMGGTAVMGLGLAMQAMASKDIASMNQLNAAVEATGKGYDGFAGDVERLIQKQVQFGHADDEVTTALRVLTTAYNDPKKALQEMTLATDLAAAKHISLADAATMVAKAHGGAARVFKEFGVTVGTNTDGTKNYDGALTVLSGKLAGQASASMDTFSGKVKQAATWLENQATTISAKYGPAVTIAGGVVTAFGSVMQVMAARSAAAALAQDGAAVATGRLSKAMSLAGSSMKMLGGPLLIAVAALGYFAKQSADSSARVDELSQTLDAQTGAITTNTRAWVAKNLSDSGALGEANRLGISVADVTDAVLGNTDAVTRVTAAVDAYDASLPKNRKGMLQSAETHHLLSNAISGGNDELNRGIDKAKLQAAATKAGSAATSAAVAPVKTLAQQQKDLADKTKTATDKINAYNQALQDAGMVVLSTRDARRQMIQSVVDATKAIQDNGQTLNINTQKGRDNAAALDAVAGKAIDLSKSVYAETHSEAAMRDSLVASRASLVKTAEHFGMTKAQANTYADSVLKIPSKKQTAIILAGIAKAKADAASIQAQVNALHGKTVTIALKLTGGHAVATGIGGAGGQVSGHARGTSSFGGGLTWINEEGPELVSLPRGSAIHSAGNTRSMFAGGGSGSSTPLVVQLVLDSRVVHQSLLALKRTTGGGLALG